MNNIDNPLSEYQPPYKEAMINFGIDISREAAEKYGIKTYMIPARYVIDDYNALLNRLHPTCCDAMLTF